MAEGFGFEPRAFLRAFLRLLLRLLVHFENCSPVLSIILRSIGLLGWGGRGDAR